MALDVAMKRPALFDRVLIMNPEIGPPSPLLYPAEALLKHKRPTCEPERNNPLHSGGYCQYKFGHIGSVWALVRHL